jgi:hypothetical protein
MFQAPNVGVGGKDFGGKEEQRKVKYLREFTNGCNRKSSFGASAIQRFCKVGYFTACEVMDWGIETGVFVSHGNKGQCKFNK